MRLMFLFSILFLSVVFSDSVNLDESQKILIEACQRNNVERIKEYIEKGYDFNFHDDCGHTPLYYCVINENIEMAKKLVENGAKADEYEIVEGAASRNLVEVLECLIANGAFSGKTGEDNKQEILSATFIAGKHKTIDFLVKNGAVYKRKFLQFDYGNWDSLPLIFFYIDNQNIEALKYFLNLGVDVNEKSEVFGSTALTYACMDWTYEAIDLLIEKGAKVNDVTFLEQTALSEIFTNGDKFSEKKIAAIQTLLSHGAELSGECFFEAITSENIPITQAFLDKGYTMREENKSGITPFMNFVASGKSDEVLKYLIKRGADIHYKNSFGQTPLMYAILKGNLTMVEKLVQAGAAIDSEDKYGWNACMYASFAEKNKEEIRDFLKKNNAKITLFQQLCVDAFAAVNNCDLELLKTILKKDPDILNTRNYIGNTLLLEFLAGQKNKKHSELSPEKIKQENMMIEYLLEQKIDINAVNNLKINALIYAVDKDIEYADNLIDMGAVLTQKDFAGNTVLMIACYHRNAELIKKILDKRRELIFDKNDNEQTILNFFTFRRSGWREEDIVILEILLQYGADVNTQDMFGRTPLLNVTFNRNFLPVMELLLKNGANVNIKDKMGKTIFDYFRPELWGNQVIELLEKYKNR